MCAGENFNVQSDERRMAVEVNELYINLTTIDENVPKDVNNSQ